METMENILAVIVLGFIFSMMLGFYFLPTIIAIAMNNVNTTAIFLLNFFTGWTGMGWLGSLIWAVIK